MAGVASHAFVDMNAVVEIYKVGKVVDPRPHQGLVAAVTLPYRFQQGLVRPDLGVTIHAGLGRWDTGESGVLDRCVTVAAVDTQTGDMMLMAERSRLWAHDPSVGDVGRASQGGGCSPESGSTAGTALASI